MTRILIVEDERHLAEGLRFNLEAEGYDVGVVENGEAALEVLDPAAAGAQANSFDLMVLDVMLPGKDGFQVISELRQRGQFLPTLMLTARGRPEDVLLGFEAGADDYLGKPFELGILLARIRGLLRRKEWLQSAPMPAVSPESPANVYPLGNRTIDFNTLEIHAGSETYPLTVMEANLLRYLLKHEGKAVSRKAMLEEVWGVREDTDTRPIDNFIVRLRRYLEDDPGNPEHLLTVRGVGYRFVSQKKVKE